uniref:Uncharacterized protein n=1 Tax=Cyprinus carpio TaxID=7962 RepID=A0A8C1M7I5_CYPCA
MDSRQPNFLPRRLTLIHQGPPKRYRLYTQRNVLDDNGKVRKLTYGMKDTSKPNKIILLVGETGTGKTTLINSMVNYLLGVKFEDEIWYEITEEAAIVNNIVFLITHSDGLPPKNVLGAINKAKIPCRRDKSGQPVHFLFNNRQAEGRQNERRYLRAQRDAFEDSVEEMKTFLETLDEKNRSSLELTSDVLIERIQFEAYICNLQLRVQEMEQKKAEKLQIQEAMVQNKEKIEECKNFTIQFKKSVKIKVPIESASWKNRKATTCTVCEENCHEFGCWWVSDPSKCEVMKDGFCTVCTGKCHHSKHVKENKKYIVKNSTIKIDFDNLIKEYEKAEEKSKMFSGLNDRLDQDLQDIEDQRSILLFNAYRKIKHLSQIALKPDSALTLQHLDFFIPRVKEAGKETWVRELEEMKRRLQCRKFPPNLGQVESWWL